MKKIILLATTALAIPFSMAGNIGENYAGGGYALGGYAQYYSASDSDWSSFTFAPNITFFPKQNIVVNTGLTFRTTGADSKDKQLSLYAGMGYTFGYDQNAQSGLVHELGVNGYHATYTDFSGFKYDPSIYVAPYYKASYYLTERVAVYSTIRLFDLDLSSGASETVNTFLSVTGGISVHFPTSFADWTPIFK